MKPYYQHAGITLYHGDCKDVLAELPTFDLLLTDPPYGIDAASKTFLHDGVASHKSGFGKGSHIPKRDYGDSAWDDEPADAATLNHAIVKCRNSIVWGGNYFDLGVTRCWLLWDKQRGETDFADAEMAWTDLDKPVKVFRYRWNGFLRGDYAGVHTEERFHPTQKPLPLMKWCLGFAPEACTILDPYAGSGTTLRAAKDMGLTAVGIEREERYCEITAKRLAQEVLQFEVA